MRFVGLLPQLNVLQRLPAIEYPRPEFCGANLPTIVLRLLVRLETSPLCDIPLRILVDVFSVLMNPVSELDVSMEPVIGPRSVGSDKGPNELFVGQARAELDSLLQLTEVAPIVSGQYSDVLQSFGLTHGFM